ncbi:MAG: DNA-directed RNA polymerase subunit omega [Nitrospinota bacterium]
MLIDEYYEKALKKADLQKYLLTNLIALRVRQLHEGSEPLVESDGLTLANIALKEISEGAIEPRKDLEAEVEDIFG